MFLQKVHKFLVACLLPGCLLPFTASAQKTPVSTKRPVDYANGLVGTAPLDDQKLLGNAPPPGEPPYTGFTSPGAVLPNSSVDLMPINRNRDLVYPGGVEGRNAAYYYPNRMMIGFTSGSRATVMPVVGDWMVPPERSGSVYNKATEKSSPGYYSAYLDDYKTKAEMTVTQRTGIFRFTFPATDKAHVLLDLGMAGGTIEVVGDRTVRGQVQRGRSGHHASEFAEAEDGDYFVAEFSKPFAKFGVFKQLPLPAGQERMPLVGQDEIDPGARTLSGHYAGAYAQFTTAKDEQVLVKIASGSSYAAAEAKLTSEDPGWDFDRVHNQAEAAWGRKLNLIEVEGGTEKEKMLFYSCLLHSFASPRLVMKKGEQYTGSDGALHTAEYDHYGPVPYWDTGRNQVVLLTLLDPPSMTADIMRSQLDMAKNSGYMGVSFHGDHAIFMYLGNWERGIDFDWAGTYAYLRKNAMDPKGPRPFLDEYLKNGWISDVIPEGSPNPPYAGGKAGVATTLEYSWDDHAMALYAKKLGKEDDYEMFMKRARNYRNAFDPSVGFMRGRTADGQWISPFDPGEPYYNFMMKEASGWSTLWLVPHDVQGLINLLGGRDKFAAKLDEFFSTPYTAKGICRDCTGLIGQYVQGNQPDQQVAYYYDWAGQPWKTQELARKILKLMYGSDKSGYAFPGMDDQGSTSSWYVLSAMGFYTVDPSSPNYALGSPIFNKVVIHMGNGKTFEVDAHNNSARNLYIQSATLNGRPWNKPWFSHSDIVNGGKLVLEMGASPNRRWGSAPEAAPPSMSQAN